MAFDASPWGLGAALYISGGPVSFFTSRLTTLDEKRVEVAIGDHRAQQLWEALAVLVALRALIKWRTSRRIRLSFRGDNVTALTLVLRMKSPPGNLKAVAKEIALELSLAVFRPQDRFPHSRHSKHCDGRAQP